MNMESGFDDIKASLQRLHLSEEPLRRGMFGKISNAYRHIDVLTGNDRDLLVHAYVEELLGEDIRGRRWQLLFFCVSDILYIECVDRSGDQTADRIDRLVSGMADALLGSLTSMEDQELGTVKDKDGILVDVEEWWSCVCLSMVSATLSLSYQHHSLAEWMFTLLLSCGGRGVMAVHHEMGERLLPSIFSITYSNVSDLFNSTTVFQMIRSYCRLLSSGIEDLLCRSENSLCLLCGITFASMASMIVSSPLSLSGSIQTIEQQLHNISKTLVETTSPKQCAVSAYGMALSHVYSRSTFSLQSNSILCMIRASVAILCAHTNNDLKYKSLYYYKTVPRSVISMMRQKPPLSMQPWVLEEIRFHASQFYSYHQHKDRATNNEIDRRDMSRGSNLFDFSLDLLDTVTRGATVMHPKAPQLLVDSVAYLNAWRLPNANETIFKQIILHVMETLQRIPEYSDGILHTMQEQERCDGKPLNVIQASRAQLLLSILLPCCHGIKSKWIIEYLGPYCTSIMHHSFMHTSLTCVANDFCCSIFTHQGLLPEEIHEIACMYLSHCLECFSHLMTDDSCTASLLENFGVGFMTLMQGPSALSQFHLFYLDMVLKSCHDMIHCRKGSLTFFGLFESAASSLGVVSLEAIPSVCSRLRQFFIELKHRNSSTYHGCRARLYNVIQDTRDITRLPYLAENFSFIVCVSSPLDHSLA